MNRRQFSRLATTAALCDLVPRVHIAAASKPSTGLEQTTLAVANATEFLKSLTAEQRKAVQFAFAPQVRATAVRFSGGLAGRMTFIGEQYGHSIWSNYPVSDVPRPGVPYGVLSAKQVAALLLLLQALLSPRGFQKVLEIMGSDEALSKTGTPFASGIAAYTIGIFGEPNLHKPWMVQFGGHHLGLNVIIAGDRGVLAPLHTGAMPSVYATPGGTMRVLAAENDIAFELLRSLSVLQWASAIIDHDVSNFTCGPGHDGELIAAMGLKGSNMSSHQRRLLLDLIGEWAAVIADAYAAPRMMEIPISPGAARRPTGSVLTAPRISGLLDRRSPSSFPRGRLAAIQPCMYIPYIEILPTAMDALGPSGIIKCA